MRKNMVAGNWKMNTSPSEGVELAKAVTEGRREIDKSTEVVVAPPFTHLSEVVKATKGMGVAVAAQNCAAEAKGAYTGEVSAQMIAALGVEYVILGHSERRQYYGETGEVLTKKMARVLENRLRPIYCVGESLEEREAERQEQVVGEQLEVVLALTPEQFAQVVVAYEPVWAIGTGRTATSDQAQAMHAFIRKTLAARFGDVAADGCTILYGGSANPGNACELFSKRDVDGGLIGGASLKADDFLAVAKSF